MGVAIRAMESDLTLLDCYRTGKRVGDRLELVLDRTSGDSAAPLQVHYNADIHHSRLRGFLFDPNFGLHDLRGSLLMDSCYQANEVDVPAVSNTVGSGTTTGTSGSQRSIPIQVMTRAMDLASIA